MSERSGGRDGQSTSDVPRGRRNRNRRGAPRPNEYPPHSNDYRQSNYNGSAHQYQGTYNNGGSYRDYHNDDRDYRDYDYHNGAHHGYNGDYHNSANHGYNGNTDYHYSNGADYSRERGYDNDTYRRRNNHSVPDSYEQSGSQSSQRASRRQNNRRGGKQTKSGPKHHDKEVKYDSTVVEHVKAEEVSVSPAVETQASSLRHQIETNTYECMVCYDTLNAFCATYSCFQCHNIFHLTCIRQWATSKLSEELPEGETANWTCPACQVSSKDLPNRYLCFCGSVINPKYKSFVLPHSCGEKCTRIRTNCTHSCPELCHPGKCPPCSAFVIKHCLCNNESKRVKCSKRDDVFSCTKVCGKTLNCNKHFCEEVCHLEVCKPCPKNNDLPCYCGKSTTLLPCGDEVIRNKKDHTGYWACLEKCLQPLTCGNHHCPKTCHAGECSPCANDVNVVTVCACGKTKLEKLSDTKRQSCLDKIPTCKKACKRIMLCGHLCNSVCHNGGCPPCSDKSLVMCNCKSTTDSMNCSDIPDGGLKCEKVCYKKKSCGRHRCNGKCCLEDNHVCMIPCGKLLSCKIHKCEELCHRGHCMPCLLSNFSEVTCSCGRTKLDPPIPCGTPPPKCYEVCNREHGCDHPINHTCHYDDDCPICPFLVNKVCMGGHAVRFNVPCHVTDVSCGEQCQKQLACGKHRCQRMCHKGDCVASDSGECELPCEIKRIKCPHSCKAKCHGNKLCPQTVCFEKIVVTCDCHRRRVDMLCFQGATETDSENLQLSRYLNKLRSAGISVAQNDLLDYLKTSKVQCVDNCILEERNQKMAQGLGLVDVPVDALLAPSYTECLKLEVKTNKAFIIEIEEEFATLIAKYKKRNDPADVLNKVKFTYHDFKPMNHEKRKIVHELAQFYRIETQSFDDEPVRNVQLKISYGSSVPSVRLSQYFQKRVIGGVSSTVVPKPITKPVAATKSNSNNTAPNLQSLSGLNNEDIAIVFDSWEDIND